MIDPGGATFEKAKGRYSPAECKDSRKIAVGGNPDYSHVSTSHVERQNLIMRVHTRRFTRLTNAFSKKFENLAHMVARYTGYYNFIKIHKTLSVTPAMEAGIFNPVRDFEWSKNWSTRPV